MANQKPDLRREFDEWVEEHVKELEDDGAFVREKNVNHDGPDVYVTIKFAAGRTVLNDD